MKKIVIASVVVMLSSSFLLAEEGRVRDVDVQGGVEVRAHFRDSEDVDFPAGFQPVARLRTVDPGSHFEVSVISLFGQLQYKDTLNFGAKVDFIDIHDRNPTSEDKDIDVDDVQLLLGHELFENQVAVEGQPNTYVRLGKFGKMERQDDRHLESYGLVSTAFNRFEDQGIEVGVDVTSNFYLKGSYTAGNPLFIRDPNALAGDNGTIAALSGNPKRNNGIVTLYDAEVEDFDFDADYAEIATALGFRTGSADGSRVVNVMAFASQRDLQESVDLEGTVYGADLDVLDSPGPDTRQDGEISIRGTGNKKQEYGANLWLYYDDTSVFAQAVAQEIGSLERTGWEVEVAHFFELPAIFSIGDTQIFQDVSPAIRYSSLDQRFGGPTTFPAVSVLWDWEKVDVGARLGVVEGLDLTVEYAFNTFVRAKQDETMDELLATCRWRRSF